MPRKETEQRDPSQQSFIFDMGKIFLNGGIDQTPYGVALNRLVSQHDFLQAARENNHAIGERERVSVERLTVMSVEIKQLGEELEIPTDDESLKAISDQYKIIVNQRMPTVSNTWGVKVEGVDK